jgi:hypothetical protein
VSQHFIASMSGNNEPSEYTFVKHFRTIYAFTDNARTRASIVIGGAFTCLFCTVGFLNSSGIFLEYYARDLLSSNSPSTIAWIGAIAIFFLFAMSPGAGAMLDAFGPTVRTTRHSPQRSSTNLLKGHGL